MKLSLIPLLLGAALAAQTAAPPAKPAAARTAAAASSLGPSYKDLKYPPLKPVKIPEVATFTLANGMKLYLLENHELPLIGGFALIRTGNLFDPPDKVGLAQITGEVMRTGGTKSRTGDQLDVTLENMASSVESGIGETSGRVSFSSLKENADATLAIFKDVLTAPEFRQDKVDLSKSQVRSGIARRNDDAHGIAQREFPNIVYGRDNPYGWDMEYSHIDNIRREDLITFYKRYFFPANVLLAIQGDFNTAEMKAKIEKLFADWEYKQPAVPAFPKVTTKPSAGIYLATKNDVTQSFFTLGHIGGMLNDRNHAALEVMNDILGGGFASRLFRVVRTRQGLAYSVGSAWGANYQHPGLFRISGSTKSPSTVAALKAIQAEIQNIRSQEVTDQELETAKQSALNSFVFNFDSPGKTLSRLVTYEYYGYPRDFIFTFQKAVEQVSKADVLRVAKQYLKPENLAVVVVGKPDDFGTALTTLGAVTPVDLSIPEPRKQVTQANPAAAARGQELLRRAQQAMGGAEKLAAVKDAVTSNEVQLQPPQGGGTLTAKQRNEWISPNEFRQTQELPFGRMIVYANDKTGWMVTPQGQAPLAEPVRKQIQDQLFRIPFTLYLSDRNPKRTVSATGPDAIEIAEGSQSVRIEFDPATGLPLRQSFSQMGRTVTESFSEWKEIDGIKVPTKFVIEQDGKKFGEGRMLDFKANPGLKVEDLSKKP